MAKQENRPANAYSSDQTNTVRVNPARRNIQSRDDRNVVVFDDFTTTGISLEWARNLLYAAGAGRVVIMIHW
jgi:predicted amidophosphoribosyltransferase